MNQPVNVESKLRSLSAELADALSAAGSLRASLAEQDAENYILRVQLAESGKGLAELMLKNSKPRAETASPSDATARSEVDEESAGQSLRPQLEKQLQEKEAEVQYLLALERELRHQFHDTLAKKDAELDELRKSLKNCQRLRDQERDNYANLIGGLEAQMTEKLSKQEETIRAQDACIKYLNGELKDEEGSKAEGFHPTYTELRSQLAAARAAHAKENDQFHQMLEQRDMRLARVEAVLRMTEEDKNRFQRELDQLQTSISHSGC